MHSISKMAAYVLCLLHLSQHPKASAQNERLYAIESLPLEVSASRTVSLSFPAPVIAVDRGSAELLAQKPKSTQNIILLKAARADIAPTSLVVITADGDLHLFQVRYQEQPATLGLQLISTRRRPPAARVSASIDQNQIEDGIGFAAVAKANVNRKQKKGGFSAKIEGLYVSGPIIYLRLNLDNRSRVDYDIEALRLFSSDKKQIDRSASQRQELTLIGSSAEINQVKAGEKRALVLAIAKLTLPKSKRLSLSVTEQNGARNLKIDLAARHLSKIAAIPSLKI